MERGGDFIDRIARAAPGETFEYGRGNNPPRELVQAMRPYVDAGVLHPTQKRVAGEMRFLVQRGRGDFAQAARGPRRGAVRRRRVRKSTLTLVLECLVRAVRREQACPTNEEIAAACGLTGKLAASYRVRRLVAAGKIAVVDHSPWGRRVVTILTGPMAGRSTPEAAL